jgi:hypothetical protein
MAVERFTGSQTDAVPGAVDLTNKEFFAAKRTAGGLNLCGAGDFCDGVISEGKAAGLSSSIKTGNQVKAIAGAAVAVGAKVTPNAAAKFITATAGSEVFGTAISAAAGADELFTIEIDRSNIDIPA